MKAAIAYGAKKFFLDITRLFGVRFLPWHALAIALTWILVVTGIDWLVVREMRGSSWFSLARSAGMIGFVVPIALPLIALALGLMRRNALLIKTWWLTAQAGITGLLLSFFYKALTGRPGPIRFSVETALADNSDVFQFGFLRGGVFWGWPSSHITVAIAGMVVLMLLYRHNKVVVTLAGLYALYMAVAVSVTFHWLSDGVAGVIFGAIAGFVVAGGHFNTKKV